MESSSVTESVQLCAECCAPIIDFDGDQFSLRALFVRVYSRMFSAVAFEGFDRLKTIFPENAEHKSRSSISILFPMMQV